MHLGSDLHRCSPYPAECLQHLCFLFGKSLLGSTVAVSRFGSLKTKADWYLDIEGSGDTERYKGQTWSWSMAEKASWPRLPVPAHKSYLLTGKTKRCRNELTTDTMCSCFGNLSTRGKKTLQCHAKTKVGKKNRREPATHTYILGPSLLRAKIKCVSTWDTEAVNIDQRFALKNSSNKILPTKPSLSVWSNPVSPPPQLRRKG